MTEIWRDIKHTGRSLRKAPGFLIVVVLTLGLGIGANAAIFSLMDQVLLRPLPVHDPASLVLLDGPGAFRGRTLQLTLNLQCDQMLRVPQPLGWTSDGADPVASGRVASRRGCRVGGSARHCAGHYK